ncbi:hypothetical protein AIOL_001968 [Candidatus Rhodobacter oscarellae]|uniref:Heme exporter protein D n=1 Tax=Candidatus Rhodobacter oscarellae TaxID=1675527 RepID=A0A0J9E2P4_9RHOB|nr:heme exporter protein CcmD [Candidatus Rhodobacter lobularis]KMW57010.1 hypothetical protein AIOL_001968 [Candidatus Rhodobacter lobularis]
MMPDLGKYAGAVLSAYGVSLALILGIVVLSVLQARRARQRLAEAEARRDAR